jgi:hypothetical protein
MWGIEVPLHACFTSTRGERRALIFTSWPFNLWCKRLRIWRLISDIAEAKNSLTYWTKNRDLQSPKPLIVSKYRVSIRFTSILLLFKSVSNFPCLDLQFPTGEILFIVRITSDIYVTLSYISIIICARNNNGIFYYASKLNGYLMDMLT